MGQDRADCESNASVGNQPRSALLRGALGGLVATGAMSAVMVAGDCLGLMGEQPPKEITAAALQKAGADDPTGSAGVLAPVAHVGFGAAAGATYSLLRKLALSVPSVPLGIGFGLAVYGISYKGWIPALAIMPRPSATDGADRPSCWPPTSSTAWSSGGSTRALADDLRTLGVRSGDIPFTVGWTSGNRRTSGMRSRAVANERIQYKHGGDSDVTCQLDRDGEARRLTGRCNATNEPEASASMTSADSYAPATERQRAVTREGDLDD